MMQKNYRYLFVGIIFALALLLLLIYLNDRRIQIARDNNQIRDTLNFPHDSSISEVIDAIPNQFELGSDRESVIQRMIHLDPNLNLQDPQHGFNTCNSGGCSDYVILFADSYRFAFIFSYDELGRLRDIKYDPS